MSPRRSRQVRPEPACRQELYQLSALLAEVVMLAGDRALFPGRLEVIAELAMEHPSVRAALLADEEASR